MLTVLTRLPGENNKEYSYRVIREAIMSLELKPGQAISEIELAESLQISRTPIREVMAKLREEYLVEVLPQVGTYVSKIKSQLIDEAAFMRFTLEREILRQSCESFPIEMILELKRNVALQEELMNKKNQERAFLKLDENFHFTLFHGMKKDHVWAAIKRLSTHYNRMRILSELQTSFEEAIAHHKKIIQIIENKDIDQVDELAETHIIRPIKHWGSLFTLDSPYMDYFDRPYQPPAIK